MKRCSATIIVKDECAILPFRCERENGHSRQHLIHYPGQWGEVKIPVEWIGNDRQEVEFYRNSMLDEPVADGAETKEETNVENEDRMD